MSNKKQSSIDWLVGELNQKIDFIPMDKWDEIRDMVQQAKAMQHNELKESYNNGYANGQLDAKIMF